MLDEFREQANMESSFEVEETQEDEPDLSTAPARSSGQFLGMTPAQRFIVATMLLAITCLISSLCLMVTGKVVPPFL